MSDLIARALGLAAMLKPSPSSGMTEEDKSLMMAVATGNASLASALASVERNITLMRTDISALYVALNAGAALLDGDQPFTGAPSQGITLVDGQLIVGGVAPNGAPTTAVRRTMTLPAAGYWDAFGYFAFRVDLPGNYRSAAPMDPMNQWSSPGQTFAPGAYLARSTNAVISTTSTVDALKNAVGMPAAYRGDTIAFRSGSEAIWDAAEAQSDPVPYSDWDSMYVDTIIPEYAIPGAGGYKHVIVAFDPTMTAEQRLAMKFTVTYPGRLGQCWSYRDDIRYREAFNRVAGLCPQTSSITNSSEGAPITPIWLRSNLAILPLHSLMIPGIGGWVSYEGMLESYNYWGRASEVANVGVEVGFNGPAAFGVESPRVLGAFFYDDLATGLSFST